MSEPMKKHRTDATIRLMHDGVIKQFVVPQKELPGIVAELKKMIPRKKTKEFIRKENLFKKIGFDIENPAIVLKNCRLDDGLTQKQLAEKVDVLATHISEMEKEKRPIGKALAKKLAKVFTLDYRMFL